MPSGLEKVVLEGGLLTRRDLDATMEQSAARGVTLYDLLVHDLHIDDERLADAFARHLRLPRVSLAATPPDAEAVKLVPEKLARKHECVPVHMDANVLVVAMANPLSLEAITDLEFAISGRIQTVVASRTEVLDAIEEVYAGNTRLDDILSGVLQDPSVQFFKDLPEDSRYTLEQAERAPVVRLGNLIIAEAVAAGASDVHVEPDVYDLKLRFRIDGVLRDFMQTPKWLHGPLVSRFKVLAKLDIAERRTPQDGRLRLEVGGQTRDVRVSTLPTHMGEKVVLRLLGSMAMPTLDSLGFSARQRVDIDHALRQPQGMVLITGPTGSGKTTSLYAMMMQRRSREVNVVTVEDPIEYELPGMTQVQVNVRAGLTFASGLRAILRQDPDIILIGEIRDAETAQIAHQASMTGHLVLSTVHTNNAIATVSRLLDLEVDPFTLSSSLNLIVAQRLVRRVCGACTVADAVTEDVATRLQLAPGTSGLKRGAGCSQCWHTGFHGRIVIAETLRVTPALRQVIQRRGTESELRRIAVESGYTPLLQDGLDKLLQGLTSAAELLRVLQVRDTERIRCDQCRAMLDAEFATCPYCLASRQKTCSRCASPLKPEWNGCPYCRAPEADPPPARRKTPAALPMPADPGTQPVSAVGSAVDAPDSGPATERAPEVTKEPHIVIVDDDADIRLVARLSLKRLPCPAKISEAATGEEALDLARAGGVDMVVLDLGLPGIDGFEVCQQLRADVRTAFVPILMLTANADQSNRVKGFMVGTDDFVAKPFSPPELTARVARLLRRTYGI